jgi:hypothetical protein
VFLVAGQELVSTLEQVLVVSEPYKVIQSKLGHRIRWNNHTGPLE